MEVVVVIFVVAAAFWPIYELIVHWHGIGLIPLAAVFIALYALHLRRLYRNAKTPTTDA